MVATQRAHIRKNYNDLVPMLVTDNSTIALRYDKMVEKDHRLERQCFAFLVI